MTKKIKVTCKIQHKAAYSAGSASLVLDGRAIQRQEKKDSRGIEIFDGQASTYVDAALINALLAPVNGAKSALQRHVDNETVALGNETKVFKDEKLEPVKGHDRKEKSKNKDELTSELSPL